MTARPFIIPIFLPHMGCPNYCIFCNQRTITGTGHGLDLEKVPHIIRQGVCSPKRGNRPAQIAFYGGNFASIPFKVQEYLFNQVSPYLIHGEIHAIRISTRPDTLTASHLQYFRDKGVTTIELGVQSLDPKILALCERGHTVQDVHKAVGLCKEHGFITGLQLMIGLPGDSRGTSLVTTAKAVRLGPHIVRIYPTLVLEGSKLASLYRRHQYLPLSLEQAVSLCADMVERFESAGITVIRIGLQDSVSLSDRKKVLAGPHHPAMGHLVRSEIWLRKTLALLQKRKKYSNHLRIVVAPRDISLARGYKNHNIQAIKRQLNMEGLEIEGDEALKTGGMRFE